MLIGWLSDQTRNPRLGIRAALLLASLAALIGFWGTPFARKDTEAMLERPR